MNPIPALIFGHSRKKIKNLAKIIPVITRKMGMRVNRYVRGVESGYAVS